MSAREIKRKVRGSDVAARAGVSRTAVSYVLNGREGVSIPEGTRARILAAAAELGYRPNRAARALVSGRTGLVSFWTIGSTVRVEYEAVRRFGRLCAEDGRELIVARSDAAPNLAAGAGPMPHAVGDWPVDGIVAYNVFAHLPPAERLGVPMVSCGVYVSPEGDAVSVDFVHGAREAVGHLAGLGRRRIAFLTSEFGARADRPRVRGYLEGMRGAGLEPDLWITGGAEKRDGYLGVARRLREGGLRDGARPDAIFAFSDELAVGAARALREAGLSIPGDVALVGCDGIDDLEYLAPPVSTVAVPYDALCRLAYELLNARIADPARAPERHVLKPDLVIRGSSDPLALLPLTPPDAEAGAGASPKLETP